MTTDTIGWSGAALLVARLATMVALSCASYYLVERPLRRADWGALHRRLHVPTVGFAAAGVVVTAAVILVGTVGPPTATSAEVAGAAATVRSRPPCPGPAPRLPPATPGHPYRAWLFGDSVMVDSSLGIIAALQATGVGLGGRQQRLPRVGAEYRSDLAHRCPADPGPVPAAGGHRDLVVGRPAGRRTNPAGTCAELERFLAPMLEPSDGVRLAVLLQFPPTGPDRLHQRHRGPPDRPGSNRPSSPTPGTPRPARRWRPSRVGPST